MSGAEKDIMAKAACDCVSRFLGSLDTKRPNPENWRDLWRGAASAGLLRLTMPSRYGGRGCTATAYVEAMRTLGRSLPDNGFTMGLNSHVWTVQEPLLRFGTEAQQAAYLPGLCDGSAIGAYALTEAQSGSDAMALQTRAEARDGGYLLNGEKTFIGMGPDCDVALVFASTAPDRKSWGLSVFIVEAKDEGFQRGALQGKIGLTTLPMGTLAFSDCWIPESRRLGPDGAGARIFQTTLDWERAFILATHVGAMERQLQDCASFAKSRQSFGKPIIDHQSVANRIADMALRLETSSLILAEAARQYDAGALTPDLAAKTNLHISEAFLASSTDALRTMGGAGFLQGSQIGEDVTDALGGVIYSGTSDVQRQIIARMTAQKTG